ncbi:hypothetical protein CPAR01_12743 [Colletotrichum paranaense]|uniref:Uncharacterized protein n=1 Tax=Colletotrichum paranaense TaxID=1914294 RepID=A0ABQ9S7A4_9PEZI|nr:uncharacterized protein CPAR01_12743 [Colletotrichum paranaense]KAK1528185.1 hypothetical protein CPAR01_12743 [Colletotrichum paranaense]
MATSLRPVSERESQDRGNTPDEFPRSLLPTRVGKSPRLRLSTSRPQEWDERRRVMVGEGGKEAKRETKSETGRLQRMRVMRVCESVRAGSPRPSRRGTASGCRMRALVLLFLASVSPRRVCDPLWAEKRWDYPGKQTNGTALTPGRKQGPYAKSLLKASRVQRANRNLSTLARLPVLHSVDTVRLGSLQSAAVVRIAYYGIS